MKDLAAFREFCDPDLCGRKIGAYTIPGLDAFPSLKDHIVKWEPGEKSAVLRYLSNPDYLVASSTSSYKQDVFTGETIPYSGDAYEDRAGYSWNDYLVYYVDVYNIGLPSDFVLHAVNAA